MNKIVDDLLAVEHRCSQGAALIEAPHIADGIVAIREAADDVGRSWSGSWLGYRARVYYAELQPPPPGANFSPAHGLDKNSLGSKTRGDWREYEHAHVSTEVLRRAGNPDLDAIKDASDQAKATFETCKEELQSILDAYISIEKDERLQTIRGDLAKLESSIPAKTFKDAHMPKGEFPISDMRLLDDLRIIVPPHLSVKFSIMSLESPRSSLLQVAKLARQARLYMERRIGMKGKSRAQVEGTIFIGHGRSSDWRDLKDLVRENLGLVPDEFNLQSAAGLTTAQRLEEMLDSAVFAFLVMTAEDEHADNILHARENVIHEVGLFQGRLGFRRAIVLLEEGCKEFSNIQGLGQIRFTKGSLKAKSEEIRQVLKREGVLKS
ncbi:nucleotide-binding protein [Pyxidicoccus parkwayensis]|uniref:Nucleotide-binding protein n=1 Tax=Pyxidicoccus parkwayensis TaxID=2813578 RepID=A0ABX7NLS4_9BACT|nr:nucleotide-binding protein [Pyxidicoccus parkwaysis]QSQ19314.1 nucleotide-binding protein [Pyxidicoccus parkwaysis]